jgi:outer membrane protein OmpA-like peptidoglycan-associated protein
MRSVLFAALLCLLGSTAFAQDARQQMDRAEEALSARLAPAGVAVERTAPDEIRLTMPSDITFDFDRANVRREFMPRIRDLAHTLLSSPAIYVDIVGHADAIGPDAYNQELSELRALSVSAALSDYGVPRGRVATSGLGEFSPVATNATEWGRARNRRVEIRLTAGACRTSSDGRCGKPLIDK